ncbi:MAG: hypothetical protein Q8R40_01695 [bacterium]|nr:hypothetical protein [bacterium]
MMIKEIASKIKPVTLIIVGTLIIINIVLLFLFIWRSLDNSPEKRFPEIAMLSNQQLGYDELAAFFREVAKKKGASYAFELMSAAPIPPNIDMHLVAHEVGTVLYQEQGALGIRICTEDFRNACSHSVVVGLFRDKGETALPSIADACRKAPGGSGAYTMCFHGLGHGILAYTGYNLEQTVSICKKTGTAGYNFREYPECVGGSIMEIIGGVHDAALREKQAKKYLSKENPLSPCSLNFIDDTARPICYLYLTPHLFVSAGADLGNPTTENFTKAFTFCAHIASSDVDRDACYAGFGKEYIGIVRGRDARLSTLNNIDDGKLKRIYDWCMLTENASARRACLMSAENSLYWGGEHGEELPLSFCRVIDDESYRSGCFANLVGALHFYKPDFQLRKEACKKFPEPYKTQCITP